MNQATEMSNSSQQWNTICLYKELTANAGVCALFNNQQIAIFFCQRSDNLYAVSNYDPIGEANVMSRGIMGCLEGETYVSSPIYKQHFNLMTGECLESTAHSLKTYDVRIANNKVQLKETS